MKKIICLFSALVLLTASGCGAKKSEEKTDTLTADMLMTPEEAKGLVSYEPVMSVENTRQKSVLRFESDPVGEDPVVVELYPHNGRKSVAGVYEEFKQRREKRPTAQDITEYDAEAFLAYPSVNIYRDGYMVVVTAGSGGNDEQAALLKKAGAIATTHLVEFLKENPTDADLIEKE